MFTPKKVFVIFITLLFIASCASSMRINKIRNNPDDFHDKKVSLSGTVEEVITVPVLKLGFYKINDRTGDLWVKPKEKTPKKGDRVRVSGVIKVGLTISGKSFGLILIEE